MSELLRMEGIEKSFPGVKALTGVNLTLKTGELHALIGENGAGKSTLMKILAGVCSKDSGKIFISGKEVKELTPDIAQKLGISIIYQEFNLFPDLTVSENIFIRRESKKLKYVLDDKTQNRKTQEILDLLELKIRPRDLVATLSVAQQQMVEIAKALSMNSQILVMDEPTAALTESEINELFKVIRDLKKKGVGIVYISHRLEELDSICDRITILRDGKFIKMSNYKDMTMPQIIASMVGRDLNNKFPAKTNKPDRKNVLLQVNEIKCKNGVNVSNLNLYKGEILGIYGLMGSGRTEFARAIFGVDSVIKKDVRIFGEKMKAKSPHDAIKYGLGYLTEDRKKDGLALELDCQYNINLPSLEIISKYGIVNEKKAEKNTLKYIDELTIKTPSIRQIAKNLSGGNQQKLVIGKWLCRDSKIMIFDEPTRGIDVGAKFEVYELMIELAKKGIGVIMISSELPEIIGVSDRVIVMREGKISGELNGDDLTEEKILSYAIS